MDNRTYLSLTGQQAVLGLLNEAVAGQTEQLDILARWASLTLQPSASTATLASTAMSTDGLISQYTGNVVFPYQKRNLNALLPYPLVYPVEYDTTFVRLGTYLRENYGILLEDGEFTAPGNSQTTPLVNTDPIDATPDATTGLIRLVATAQSGRFVNGSYFYVFPTAAGVPFALTAIAAVDSALDFHLVTDHF